MEKKSGYTDIVSVKTFKSHPNDCTSKQKVRLIRDIMINDSNNNNFNEIKCNKIYINFLLFQ